LMTRGPRRPLEPISATIAGRSCHLTEVACDAVPAQVQDGSRSRALREPRGVPVDRLRVVRPRCTLAVRVDPGRPDRMRRRRRYDAGGDPHRHAQPYADRDGAADPGSSRARIRHLLRATRLRSAALCDRHEPGVLLSPRGTKDVVRERRRRSGDQALHTLCSPLRRGAPSHPGATQRAGRVGFGSAVLFPPCRPGTANSKLMFLTTLRQWYRGARLPGTRRGMGGRGCGRSRPARRLGGAGDP